MGGFEARRPRLDDVAAAAGVSVSTVSLVLRGIAGPSAGTRRRVLEAAASLAYRPDLAASVLASRRSRLVGVVLDISNPFHGQLIQDLHGAAHRAGLNLVLSTVTREQDERGATETLLDSRCGALLLLGPTVSAQHLEELVGRLPIVVLGRPSPSPKADVVRTDDVAGLDLAVAHLERLGHRRIVFVDGGGDAASPIRGDAYERSMRRHNLAAHIELMGGGDTERAGAEAAALLLRNAALPTGIITFNDRSAIGLIETLRRAGVDVPGAVSVIGYDDSPTARLGHVDLTTVAQDTALLTSYAMAKLVQRLDGDHTEGQEAIVAPHLKVRGSTAAPGAP